MILKMASCLSRNPEWCKLFSSIHMVDLAFVLLQKRGQNKISRKWKKQMLKVNTLKRIHVGLCIGKNALDWLKRVNALSMHFSGRIFLSGTVIIANSTCKFRTHILNHHVHVHNQIGDFTNKNYTCRLYTCTISDSCPTVRVDDFVSKIQCHMANQECVAITWFSTG